jgi:hypothetical protein
MHGFAVFHTLYHDPYLPRKTFLTQLTILVSLRNVLFVLVDVTLALFEATFLGEILAARATGIVCLCVELAW